MITKLGSVFIVDDERELMTALCEMLGEQGYETKGFTSGEEALKALEGQDTDVLLTDVMMPGMDGITLLKSALDIDSNLVGIMMTGHGTIQTAVQAMKTGAFDYVLKPFRLAELVPVLSRAMEVRRLRLENMQLRETVAIYELTKVLAYGLDLNTILNKVADAAIQQCEADESSIMLFTPEGDHLYVAAIGGRDRHTVLGERIKIGEGIAGWVARHREPLVLNKDIEDPWLSAIKPRPGIVSSISVPMLSGGKLTGVLNVNDSHGSRPFTLGKVKALSILASIGATALESATLFSRTKEAEEKYRTLVEQLPAITYVVSLDGGGYRTLYVSPKVGSVLGITADEWIDNPDTWQKHVHDDDRSRVLEEIGRCRSCGERFVSEYRMVTRDNRTVWIHDEALQLSCSIDRPVVLQGIMMDITNRKLREEALQTSEAMNRLLIEESPLGIGIVQHARLTYVNPTLLRIFGYSAADEMLDLPAVELVAPEQREWFLSKPEATPEDQPLPAQADFRGLRRNGDPFDIQVWPKTIQYLGQPAILFFAEDTTDAKGMRAQILQLQKMEAAGTLAGGIAHDFNNILTVVLGYTELLLSKRDPADPEYEDLMKVVTVSKRGAGLVRRLLTFSRKAEAHPLPLNLNYEIDEMKKLLSRVIPNMIAIDLRLTPDVHTVNADSVQMGQLLMNLAVNAKDAMPEGGRLVIETKNVILDDEYCRSHLECTAGRYVLLSVSDTGVGMDRETVNRIFEPFFTTKQPGQGTGLGLSTVYGIVKQHNGYIMCYSEPGHGTTFKIYLPALETDRPADEAQREAVVPAGGTETILLVDDEEFVRDLGTRLLRRAGYTILAAGSSREALDLYRQQGESISLVILDLVMPGMGGKECLEELSKMDPDVKVIISSGYSVEGRTRHIIESGAAGFVTKPFSAAGLLQTVRDVLDAGPAGHPPLMDTKCEQSDTDHCLPL